MRNVAFLVLAAACWGIGTVVSKQAVAEIAPLTLLPIQLEGLDRLVEDLTVVRLPDAGHFAPWEAPEPVAEALGHFLASAPAATAPVQ